MDMPAEATSQRLALVGYGKMGRMVESLAPEFGFEVSLKLDEFNNVGGEGITAESFEGIDVAIDFSIPPVVADNTEKISALGVNVVIGTTGWLDQIARVRSAVERANIGLVYGANFSVGVQVFYRVAEAAATFLATENDYDAWAYEIHHKMKKDAPSGTLLRLVEKNAGGWLRAPDRSGQQPRRRSTGKPSDRFRLRGRYDPAHPHRAEPSRLRPRCTAHRPLDHRAQGAVRVLNGLGPHGGRALGKLNRLGR